MGLSRQLGDDANPGLLKVDINVQTGTAYTITASDNGAVIEFTNAATVTVTVPLEATEDLGAGFNCTLVRTGDGTVTVAPEGAVVLNSPTGLSLINQFDMCMLYKTGTDEFNLVATATSQLDALTDTTITSPASGDVLTHNGTDWDNAVAIGTAANNLVQLNGSAQLPAVDGSLLTGITSGVNLEEEGAAVTGGPHTTIDFVGANVTVTDAGSGEATVTITGSSGVETKDEGTQVDAAATALDFVGAGVTATDAGAGVTTVTIPGVTGAGSSVGFKGASVFEATTAQTLTTSTLTVVTFTGEDYDSNGYHESVTNKGRMTVPEAGYYLVVGSVTFISNATGERHLGFIKNGNTADSYGRTRDDASGVNAHAMTTSYVFKLAANDYIEMVASQSSGGNLDLIVSTINSRPKLSITKIETATAGGQFSGVSVTDGSTQTLTHATNTAVNFDTEYYDTDTYHDNVTNNTRLTAPTTGYYHISARVPFLTNVSGRRAVSFEKNGSGTVEFRQQVAPSDAGTDVVTNGTFYLEAGDYIEVIAYQSSGGNLDIGSASALIGCRATMTRLETTAPVSYAVIRDAKTAGTEGGTATSGSWETRDLTEITSDPNSIVTSLVSNEFTLAAGSYLIDATVPGYDVDRHMCRLYDVTGVAEVEVGSGELASVSDAISNASRLSVIVQPAASNTYRIEHQVQTTKASQGHGVAMNGTFTVSEEVYTVVKITKFNT